MSPHQGRFEAGRVLLPVEAPWLADFESELLSFPNGRYDDQVDAFMLFLDWFSNNEPNINMNWVEPIAITRADMEFIPLIKDRTHDLPITKQAKALNISRGSVYYRPRPVSAADLTLMRRIDELHLEFSHSRKSPVAAGDHRSHLDHGSRLVGEPWSSAIIRPGLRSAYGGACAGIAWTSRTFHTKHVELPRNVTIVLWVGAGLRDGPNIDDELNLRVRSSRKPVAEAR